MSLKQVIRGCEVFSGLSDTELESIVHSAEEKQFEAGTTVFETGGMANELLVLQEGKIALQISLPQVQGQMSRKVTVDIVSKNEVVGWSAVVEPYVYTLTGVCLQQGKALSLSATKLRSILQDNHEIGYKVMKEITKVIASRLEATRYLLVSERSTPMRLE